MSWATFAKEALGKGDTVQIKPRGHSMKGKVNDGDLVVVEPCDASALVVGDIVLVRVHGNDYLHLVKAIDKGRFPDREQPGRRQRLGRPARGLRSGHQGKRHCSAQGAKRTALKTAR